EVTMTILPSCLGTLFIAVSILPISSKVDTSKNTKLEAFSAGHSVDVRGAPLGRAARSRTDTRARRGGLDAAGQVGRRPQSRCAPDAGLTVAGQHRYRNDKLDQANDHLQHHIPGRILTGRDPSKLQH